MLSNCSNNLINLKGVIINSIKYFNSNIDIYLDTKPNNHICPCCGSKTHIVHDYRIKCIKDLPIHYRSVKLFLHKRRYVCHCGKKFYEHYDLLPKYYRMTNRLAFHILSELRKTKLFKEVASEVNLSSSIITIIFNYANYGKPKTLPTVLSIDEFKGNTSAGKYHSMLVDLEAKKVIDILPDRKQSNIYGYFFKYSKEDRCKVKFFVCDMWRPYTDIAKSLFTNATIYFTYANY